MSIWRPRPLFLRRQGQFFTLLACRTVAASALCQVCRASSAASEHHLQLCCWEPALCSGPAGNPRSARGRPPAPCFARVCCCVSLSCAIRRAVTSVASAHLIIRLEENPEGAAPGEAAASCSPEKAHTGEAKACRPTPGAGSPRHGWGLPPAPSHSASAWFQFFLVVVMPPHS